MAGVLSLVVSNPSLEDYEAHAGDQLVALGTKELCDAPTLPMVVRLWIRNCPELIAAQRMLWRHWLVSSPPVATWWWPACTPPAWGGSSCCRVCACLVLMCCLLVWQVVL